MVSKVKLKRCINRSTTIFPLLLLLFFNHSSAQWVPASSPDSVVSNLHVTKDGTFFVGTNAGLFKSQDSGTTWTSAHTGLPGLGISVVIGKGNTLYAGTGSGVFRSENNGDSWIAANGGMEEGVIFSLISVDDTLWAGTAGVFRSTDNGTSWTDVSEGLAPRIPNSYLAVSALAYKDGVVYAGQGDVDYGGGLFRFVESGGSWELIRNGLTEDPSVTSILVNGNTILVGLVFEGIVISSDNGVSWKKITGYPTTASSINAFAAAGDYIFAATWGGGVLFSRDNGLTWTIASNGLPNDGLYKEVTSIVVLGNSVFAATRSHGLWRRPISEFLPVQRAQQNKQPSYADVRVQYPAHGSQAISLTYNLPSRQSVQLSMHTLSGKRIACLEHGIKSAGRHTVTFERSLLPAGVCLYLFRAGEYAKTGCMAIAN
ncbi:MAG: hypothetical protein JXA71_16260 [Chitinispirillaceae bacterium]|nr:hypothetical protein [Chitinispirillaceae bacterium]